MIWSYFLEDYDECVYTTAYVSWKDVCKKWKG